MASGYGFNGVGRCYPFFADTVLCMTYSDDIFLCKKLFDNYMQCLSFPAMQADATTSGWAHEYQLLQDIRAEHTMAEVKAMMQIKN